jgi:hypothetical protein
MQEGWKIRQKSTGKFSKGGGMGHYGGGGFGPISKGKVWNNLCHVESHMRGNIKFYQDNGDDIELVKVELVETLVIQMAEHVNIVSKTWLDRKHKEDLANEKWHLARLKREQTESAEEIKRLEEIHGE